MTRICPVCTDKLHARSRGPECHNCRKRDKASNDYWQKKWGRFIGEIAGKLVAQRINRGSNV